MLFIALRNGSLVGLLHIVQLTPQGHLQLDSGNVLTLTDDDVADLRDCLADHMATAGPPVYVAAAPDVSDVSTKVDADSVPPVLPSDAEPVQEPTPHPEMGDLAAPVNTPEPEPNREDV
jgi:hypothetical protein